MKIHRAHHLGMCFGVRDAIALANQESTRGPLTVLGDLVHNDTVLSELRSRGVGVERNPDLVRTEAVMITAHGASEKLMTEVRRRGHRIVEATCPLVHHAHKALHALVALGLHPVVIGQKGHVEVRGLTEDYPGADVVLSREDIECMADREAFGVVAQTTQPVEKVRSMVEMIRNRFPLSRVEFRDTVCQPTKLRQNAAIELASRCDVVVVVGGANSNNTRELVTTCRTRCSEVHHVQLANEIRAEWFENVEAVGITAGTSTPDSIIDAVEKRIEEIAARRVPVARLASVA